MPSIRERHLHEGSCGLCLRFVEKARAMNKIVVEHYPVEKLDKELREQTRGWQGITLTLEEKKPASFTRADLLALKGKPAGPSVNTLEGIRALRDEWD
jgi:hypothetical protein